MKTNKLKVRFPPRIGMRTCMQQYLLSLCLRLHRLLYLRDSPPGYTCLDKRSWPWLHVPPMSIVSCNGVVNGNMIINTSALALWEVEQGLAFSCLGLYLQFMCMLYFWPSHVETAQSPTLRSARYLYCTLVDVWHHLHSFQTSRRWQHIPTCCVTTCKFAIAEFECQNVAKTVAVEGGKTTYRIFSTVSSLFLSDCTMTYFCFQLDEKPSTTSSI